MIGATGVSVDLGGSKIAAARFIDGIAVDQHRTVTDRTAGSNAQIDAIVQLIRKLDVQKTDRIGVAVSGRVDSDGNWTAINTSTLSGISRVALKSALEHRLQQPVAVMNDAVAGGLAEAHYGAGKDKDSFAYITVSTGVGGVYLLNGTPVISANGIAGHLGFTTCRNATELCGSGRLATIESIASGRAMEQQAARLHSRQLSAEAIFTCHRHGESWATDIINSSATSIAEMIANLVAIVGIELAVIGGSVGLADGYVECVNAALGQEPVVFRTQVRQAELGQKAVLLGALVDVGARIPNSAG